jgi:hypothetical protein
LIESKLGGLANSQKSEFVDAADYVLANNAELYQRLA